MWTEKVGYLEHLEWEQPKPPTVVEWVVGVSVLVLIPLCLYMGMG